MPAMGRRLDPVLAGRRPIPLLCALAGLRVFLYAAAFPFFNNVDEFAHYDLVRRYAESGPPRGLTRFRPDSARDLMLYRSWEYNFRSETLRFDLAPMPLWLLPSAKTEEYIQAAARSKAEHVNHETMQPPLYYLIAAAWHRLGAGLGVWGGYTLYWLRFLNVLIYVALMGLTHWSLRRFHPGRPFLHTGVPLLMAVMPQQTFLGINNSVLAPLCFTAAFYALLEAENSRSLRFHVLAGFLAAMSFLTKLTNAAILGIAGLVILRGLSRRSGGPGVTPLVALALGALAPILAWVGRNRAITGEWMGAGQIMAWVGWRNRTLDEVIAHPIWSMKGAWSFLDTLLATFWRGEFIWHGAFMTWRGLDRGFVVVTLLGLAAAAVRLRLEPRQISKDRSTRLLGFWALGLNFLFLAFVTLRVDFGPETGPFFWNGRFLLGVVVPILALLLDGLEYFAEKAGRPGAAWAVLGLGAAGLAAFDLARMWPVFFSRYNFFHL